MKNTFVKKKNSALLTGLLFCAAALVTASASTTVTFSVDMTTNYLNGSFNPATDTVHVSGTFNGWAGLAGLQLQEVGLTAPYIYTNTVVDTTDTNGVMLYKFVCSDSAFSGSGGYEGTADSGNRGLYLNGGTMAPPTPFFGDSGAGITYTGNLTFQVDMSQQTNLGSFNPGTQTVDVKGNFDGWASSSPLVLDPGQPGLVYTNTFPYTVGVSTNAHMAYGFEITGGAYENLGSSTNSDGQNNRFFTALPGDQTFPVVYFSDQPFTTILVSNITFSVDMSIVAITDTNFDRTTVSVDGDFNCWSDISCTNNPTAVNTNIFTSSTAYTVGLSSGHQYQFRYKTKDTASTVYDHAAGGGNRLFTAVNTDPNGTNYASVWDDASLDDYFLTPQAVTFSVSMTNSSGAFITPQGSNAVPFNPNTDNVYLNGSINGGWFPWESAQPVTYPVGYQMIRAAPSYIYTNTIIINPSAADIVYKYGTDPGGFSGGPNDNEAAQNQNHARVLRTLTASPYQMPLDTFGAQYNEPYFSAGNGGAAQLSVGSASGGTVPVSWLGRPGAHLQTKSSLTSGSWVDLWATDGTNWNAGHYGVNGLVSVTNFPTSGGNTFFRVVKP